MEAIILAAGLGSRLAEVSGGRPKCLAEVGGRALIEHQLDSLVRVGVTKVFVVVGHRAELVQSHLDRWPQVHFVPNERFAETNSLYSLWLARGCVQDDFLVLNGDVLAHPDIYRRVGALGGTGLAFDSNSGFDSEHMKVCFRDARLTGIAKDLPEHRISGENLGILRIDADTAGPLFHEAGCLLGEHGLQAWAPAVFHRMAAQLPIRGVDVSDLPWTEIDFPEDLHHARDQIWPEVGLNQPIQRRHFHEDPVRRL